MQAGERRVALDLQHHYGSCDEVDQPETTELHTPGHALMPIARNPARLDPIVFVIGAGRSGTTLLADLLGMHPAYLKIAEKRYLWMYGAYWRAHDLRTVADVTPATRAHISGFLAESLARSSAHCIIEKTPSNCFRVPFISALFPRARFIHIVRDGRAVAYSSVRAFMGEKYVSNLDRRRGRRSFIQRVRYLLQRWPEVPRRLRERDLPLSGWLPYVVRKGFDTFQVIAARKPPVWGARYPGIYADRDAYSPLEVAGIQWRESVTRAMADLNRCVPPGNQLAIRYEHLVERPHDILREVFDFLDTPVDSDRLDPLATRVRNDAADWRCGLDEGEYDTLLPHIAPMLSMLGYLPGEDALRVGSHVIPQA